MKTLALFILCLFVGTAFCGRYDFDASKLSWRPKSPRNHNLREIWHHMRTHKVHSRTPHAKPITSEEISVGIIGGGISGMYAALMLEELGVPYQIYEKESSRVGGRLYTYYFDDGPYNYGELGGMRMPNNTEYQIVFDVINKLNSLNAKSNPDALIKLIPFNLACDNGLVFVNQCYGPDKTIPTNTETDADPTLMCFPTYPEPANIWAFLDDVMGPYLEALDSDVLTGMEMLAAVNEYSVGRYIKEYLLARNYTEEQADDIVDYTEVLAFGTGITDTAFSEAIIDTYVFQAVDWHTVADGMQRFPDAFLPLVGKNMVMNAPVDTITYTESGRVEISFIDSAGVRLHKDFDHLIVTTSFPVLYHMNMPNFTFAKSKIIREMPYDNSCKVLLQFKSRFWEQGSKPIYGGTSTTDLPARTIVYPSYGMGSNGTGVIIGSYTFATDAGRLQGMEESDLIDLVLRDVATMHGEEVRDLFMGGASRCWQSYPTTLGAYAWYMPDEYPFYEEAGVPEGVIHFAGEHTSIYHGWLSGSLESAERVIQEIFGVVPPRQ